MVNLRISSAPCLQFVVLQLASAILIVSRFATAIVSEQRALSNVLLSAVQATVQGRIEWRIEDADGKLIIHLSDTGGGIPPDVMPKLFQPYFSTKDRGTGLGLAIARKDIEDQGGAIAVERSTGEGTTLAISLPIRNAAAKE